MGSVHVEHRKVGLLPGLQASELVGLSHGGGTSQRGDFQRRHGGHGLRVMGERLLEYGGLSHFHESVHVVVRAVEPESHVCSHGPKFLHRRDAGGHLGIGRRTVHHMGAGIRKDALFLVVEPDAVRKNHVVARVADAVEVTHVALMAARFHEGDLSEILRSVGMQAQTVLPGKVPRRGKQSLRTRRHEARGHGVAQTSVFRHVPAADEPLRLADAGGRLLTHDGGQIVAQIHHALAEETAQAGFVHDLEDGVLMQGGSHVDERGRAAADELHGGKPRRGGVAFHGVRSFHGPGALAQPFHEGKIVAQAAKKRLRDVHVRLHEPGNHGHAVKVHHVRAVFRRAGARPGRIGFAGRHGGNAVVHHQNVGPQHAPLAVHGNDESVAKQRLHAASPL